jgi:ABC-type dipeptide/oligopeptide/nickel transport system ATPase component
VAPVADVFEEPERAAPPGAVAAAAVEPHEAAEPAPPDDTVLRVTGLTVEAPGADGVLTLLDDISLSLAPGEVIGIVGESGSGKSVLVRALLQLPPENTRIVGGSVWFHGRDLTRATTQELRRLRGSEIAHILPDAKAQLNPVLRIGTLMEAVIRAHEDLSASEAQARAMDALRMVGIPDPDRRLRAYPHELSGGMAQRVCIALALVHNPSLIVADEPTFGLDVTVQRQVLDLMSALVRERQAAQVIVTRDLGIVAHYCQRVATMQAGRIVEAAPTVEFFETARHPHTEKLLSSVRVAAFAGQGSDG